MWDFVECKNRRKMQIEGQRERGGGEKVMGGEWRGEVEKN